LAAARLRGNTTVNGLGMLLHQGPLAWKAWCDMEPAVTPALRSLLEQSITSALP
jgi:shikimate dehydrogenase